MLKGISKTTQQEMSVCLPFAAGVLITDKVLTVLVDGVVGEMHAHIILTRETQAKRDHM